MLSTGRRNARSMVAIAMAESNGGTRSCSRASSSATSAGNRSRRVDSTWPNFTKIGPRCSSAWRSRWPRGALRVAAEREHAGHGTEPGPLETVEDQLVQAEPQRHPDDCEAAQIPCHAPACPARPRCCRRTGAAALTIRRTVSPMAWAGASPISRDRSSSRSQRTWSTSQLMSAANCTSPSMRTAGLSPRSAACASCHGDSSVSDERQVGLASRRRPGRAVRPA